MYFLETSILEMAMFITLGVILLCAYIGLNLDFYLIQVKLHLLFFCVTLISRNST